MRLARLAIILLVLSPLACLDVDVEPVGQTDQALQSLLGYTLVASPTTQNVLAGDTAAITLTTTASGLAPCVTLTISATGVPAGATVTYPNGNQVSVCPNATATTHVVVALDPNMASGTSGITFTAVGPHVTLTAIATLVVRAASFAIQVWPPAVNLSSNGVATAALDLVLDGSLTSTLATTPIALSASGLAAGVTATFSPSSIVIATNPNATVTFRASAAAVTPARVGLRGTAANGTLGATAIDVGPACQLIVNGDFEAGQPPWLLSGGMSIEGFSPGIHIDEARDGKGDVYGTGDGTVAQTIAIPSSSSHVMLAFWMRGTTSSTSRVTVEVTRLSTSVRTTLATYALADPPSPSAYRRYDLDLNPFRGDTVNVMFRISSDPGGQDGSVFLDDISVASF